MSPLNRLDERYMNDAAFHAVVDSLQAIILDLQLSAAEVREAAMYAAYRVEMRRVPGPVPIARANIEAALADPHGRGLRDSLLAYADALETDAKKGPYR